MEAWKITSLYTLSETIATPLLERYEYPWEALAQIKSFILELGNSLPEPLCCHLSHTNKI